jgi:XrtJ-associated TM-motif-TM protein
VAETGKLMMKKTLLFVALAFALTVALPARAQGGCDDSPENPTLILAGLAGGAFAVSSLRTRILARRAAKKQ